MNAAPTHPELAAELRERAEADQAVRAAGGRTPETLAAWQRVDAGNAARMWQVLRAHGWPGHALAGERGSDDAALLVQHADRDRRLQLLGLELLIEAVDAGQASICHVAYLTDRLCCHRGLPQRYGTQYARAGDGGFRMLPVQEPDGLDERRRRAGLGPVAEFERELAEVRS